MGWLIDDNTVSSKCTSRTGVAGLNSNRVQSAFWTLPNATNTNVTILDACREIQTDRQVPQEVCMARKDWSDGWIIPEKEPRRNSRLRRVLAWESGGKLGGFDVAVGNSTIT